MSLCCSFKGERLFKWFAQLASWEQLPKWVEWFATKHGRLLIPRILQEFPWQNSGSSCSHTHTYIFTHFEQKRSGFLRPSSCTKRKLPQCFLGGLGLCWRYSSFGMLYIEPKAVGTERVYLPQRPRPPRKQWGSFLFVQEAGLEDLNCSRWVKCRCVSVAETPKITVFFTL